MEGERLEETFDWPLLGQREGRAKVGMELDGRQQELIYLASPIAHAEVEIMKGRRREASELTQRLLEVGLRVFSPAVYSAEMQKQPLLGWYAFDLEIMLRCDVLLVLCQDGWRESEGVRLEIEQAHLNDMPVGLVCPVHVYDLLNYCRPKSMVPPISVLSTPCCATKVER